MVNLHRGLGGQNLGLKPGKLRNADMHHGLSGLWGDLLNLPFPNIGRVETVCSSEKNRIVLKIKILPN